MSGNTDDLPEKHMRGPAAGWSVLFTLLIWLAPPLRADPGSMPGLEAGRGVVVRLPGADRTLVRQALERPPTSAKADNGGEYQQLDATDPRLLDPLRQRLPNGVDATAGEAPVCPAGSSFTALLQQAALELDFLQRDRAAALLTAARQVLACDPAVLEPPQLARYLFLAGVLELYLEGDPQPLFDAALEIWPQMPPPTEYPTRVQQVYARARAPADRPMVRVRYAQQALAGMTLRVDGRPETATGSSLPAGPHFLQLVTPDGRSRSGALVLLPANPDAGETTLPPDRMMPPAAGEVIDQLAHAAREGRPDPTLGAVLEGVLEAAAAPWLVIVAPGSAEEPPRALWVLPGERYHPLELQGGPKRSRVGLALTAGLGAATLAATGYYGYQRHLAIEGDEEDTIDTRTEADRLYRNQVRGLTVAAVCLTGTLVSAGLTWKMPRVLFNRGGPAANRAEVRLSIQPFPAGPHVRIQW